VFRRSKPRGAAERATVAKAGAARPAAVRLVSEGLRREEPLRDNQSAGPVAHTRSARSALSRIDQRQLGTEHTLQCGDHAGVFGTLELGVTGDDLKRVLAGLFEQGEVVEDVAYAELG